MADVANGTGSRPAKLRSSHSKRREASQPWYGSSMKAQPRSEVNGEPVRRRAEPADDGLYRYVPVPPVYRDEDGYPVEDGMSQAIDHQVQTAQWRTALQRHCPTATVASDLSMPYKRGDTTKVLVPDLLVALRAERRPDRRSYRLWENPPPELVIEMLSKSTSGADVGTKRDTCERLGIREYWLFDPTGFELPTPLAGCRLCDGRYRPIDADAAGRLRSEVLGLDLHVRAGELRFRDPTTGEDLRYADESEDGRLAEKNRADAAERERAAEKDRADAAERELVRLRSRLGGL